jgi:hypothetical protein
MADIAAALAAFTLALWSLGIVLMSTVYQETGVLLAALGFLTGVMHAILQWRSANSESQLQPERTERNETMTAPEASAAQPVHIHPMVGKESHFVAWVGFFSTLLVSLLIFSILTGNWIPPTFAIGDASVGPETYIPIMAMIVYHYQVKVSLERPDTLFYAWLDLIGSVLPFAIAFIAIMSWFPAVRWILETMRLWITPYTTLTLVTAGTYLILSAWDVFWNHWRRSRVFGHGGGASNAFIDDVIIGQGVSRKRVMPLEIIWEPQHFVQQPDGTLRRVQPELIEQQTGPAPETH